MIGSPEDIWASVLTNVAGKFSLSWVQSLSLARLDDRTAVVALLPGKRDMQKFVAADRQREQLADLFKKVLGRPVRIEVEAAAGGAAPATTTGNLAAAARAGRTEREEAMALPLVKEVLGVFEAALVETYPERKNPPQVVAADTKPAAALPLIPLPIPDDLDHTDADPAVELEE